MERAGFGMGLQPGGWAIQVWRTLFQSPLGQEGAPLPLLR